MSPLGQSPNFLTDGSRIRRLPINDTKNPTFRLARRTSKNFQYPASGRSPGSVFPGLVFIYPGLCSIFVTLPSFLSRYLSDRKLLLPFPFPTSAFPAIVRHFLPSIFRAGFQRKLPVLFYVHHFSPLSVSLFSHLPPFPGSTIFSTRRFRRLSPVILKFCYLHTRHGKWFYPA